MEDNVQIIQSYVNYLLQKKKQNLKKDYNSNIDSKLYKENISIVNVKRKK